MQSDQEDTEEGEDFHCPQKVALSDQFVAGITQKFE